MNIAEVEAIHPPATGAPSGWRSWLGQILVRVRTDEGAEGYGVGGGGEAGVHIVNTVLRSILVGADAEDISGVGI